MHPDVSRSIDMAAHRLYRVRKVVRVLIQVAAILFVGFPALSVVSELTMEEAAWGMSVAVLLAAGTFGYYLLSKKTIFWLMHRKTRAYH